MSIANFQVIPGTFHQVKKSILHRTMNLDFPFLPKDWKQEIKESKMAHVVRTFI